MASYKGAKITKRPSKSHSEAVTRSFLCSEEKGERLERGIRMVLNGSAARSVIRRGRKKPSI